MLHLAPNQFGVRCIVIFLAQDALDNRRLVVLNCNQEGRLLFILLPKVGRNSKLLDDVVDDMMVTSSSGPEKIAISELVSGIFTLLRCCHFDLDCFSMHHDIIFGFIICVIFNNVTEGVLIN